MLQTQRGIWVFSRNQHLPALRARIIGCRHRSHSVHSQRGELFSTVIPDLRVYDPATGPEPNHLPVTEAYNNALLIALRDFFLISVAGVPHFLHH